MTSRIGLVILNRNEIEALPHVLPKIPLGQTDLVFAVDGGSTDGSRELLEQHGIPVLEQTSPGRGEAFRMAFNHAVGKVEALIMFSADGNEDPADIPRFRRALDDGADMVIASRMMPGATNEEDEQRIRLRKWANLTFSQMAYRTWGRGGPRITDPINGYRAITLDAWRALAPDGPGYTIEYQTSIRAYKLGLDVREFPTHEGARIGGESHAKSIPTGVKFLRLYWRERQGSPRAGG
jgi:glycosyltransferase involved in cell wall biosynthesis